MSARITLKDYAKEKWLGFSFNVDCYKGYSLQFGLGQFAMTCSKNNVKYFAEVCFWARGQSSGFLVTKECVPKDDLIVPLNVKRCVCQICNAQFDAVIARPISDFGRLHRLPGYNRYKLANRDTVRPLLDIYLNSSCDFVCASCASGRCTVDCVLRKIENLKALADKTQSEIDDQTRLLGRIAARSGNGSTARFFQMTHVASQLKKANERTN